MTTEDEAKSERAVDAAWADEFAKRWANAWNSHDAQRVLDFLTDDIVYDDSAWPETMRGKAAVREFLDHNWRAFPDQTLAAFGRAHVAAEGPRAAFWWTGTALIAARSHRREFQPPVSGSRPRAPNFTSTVTVRLLGCESFST